MADEKYLGLDGVRHLWTAITDHDNDTLNAAKNAIKGIALSYDSTNKKIILSGTGAENEVSIDATAFIKDGVLDSVKVITAGEDLNIEGVANGEKFIEFTWNADSGKTTSLLPVSDFAKAYMGSDSIDITNSNEIVVKSVDTDKTKTTDVIPIAGGPLAEIAKDLFPSGEIPEGTNMQDLLMSLFCKVEYPGDGTIETTKHSEGSMKCTLAAPSFTLSNSGTTVEVGTVCDLSEVTIPSAAVPAVNAYPKVTGFKYGYSAEDDNTRDSASTEIVGTLESGTSVSLTSDNYTMKVDYTNFIYAADSVNTTDAVAADVTVTPDSNFANVKCASDKLAVVNGTNSVKVDITGPKAVGSFASIAPHYACSNTKKTRSGVEVGEGVYHRSTELAAASDVKSGNSSNTKTLSVTGAYKYFIGCYSDEVFVNKVYTSDSVRTADCVKSGFVNGTSINYEITVPKGTRGMYIAIPAGIDDSGATLDVKQKTNSNNTVAPEMRTNLRTLSNMACAGTATKDYKIFTWSFPGGTAGEEVFTISKF